MTKKLLSLLIIFFLLINIPVFAQEEKKESEEQQKEFILFDLDQYENMPFKISDYKGKNILISMFTTWCTYCRQELPDFKKYQDEHPDDITMLMVHVPAGETFDAAEKFWKDNNLEGLTLLSDNGFLSSAFGVQGYPTNLIFDKEGKLQLYSYALSYDKLDEQMKKIKELEVKDETK